jgi:SH3-like domain-containing protein
MSVSVSACLLRLLLCGMFVMAPGAMAQTPNTQPAAQPQPKPKPKPKQTPVVRPHGPTHAQKPPAKGATKVPPAAPVPVPAPAAPPAPVEPPKPPESETNNGSATGLPLPRFAALRSDEVNLRAGPGTRYPIDWVYKRRELPVEILREFEVWRLVQDPDGIKGWVHQATLTGRRSFLVTGADATLRRDPNDAARAVAILKPGVIGHLRSCQARSDWCQVQAGDYRGYLKRGQFWGTLPDEAVAG